MNLMYMLMYMMMNMLMYMMMHESHVSLLMYMMHEPHVHDDTSGTSEPGGLVCVCVRINPAVRVAEPRRGVRELMTSSRH